MKTYIVNGCEVYADSKEYAVDKWLADRGMLWCREYIKITVAEKEN